MKQDNSIPYLMGLINRPMFCVQNGNIQTANNAAVQLGIHESTKINDLLGNSAAAYDQFSGGTMHCTLQLYGNTYNTQITRIGDQDYFLLDTESDQILSELSLAAQQLRKPMTDLLALMDSSSMRKLGETKDGNAALSQANKSMMQINRMICNMSDAASYDRKNVPMTMTGMRGLFSQIMEKTAALLEKSNIHLAYSVPENEVFTLANSFLLERAAYNMISNAVKFAEPDATINATLEVLETQVRFSVQACTSNPQPINFEMYRREPGIEDSRYGLGLGMVLVRKIASIHGGTVLADQPDETTARVTMTLAIRAEDKPSFRSPSPQYTDYSGGFDHALLELSDILSKDCYRN